jgi:hypothetical protein
MVTQLHASTDGAVLSKMSWDREPHFLVEFFLKDPSQAVEILIFNDKFVQLKPDGDCLEVQWWRRELLMTRNGHHQGMSRHGFEVYCQQVAAVLLRDYQPKNKRFNRFFHDTVTLWDESVTAVRQSLADRLNDKVKKNRMDLMAWEQELEKILTHSNQLYPLHPGLQKYVEAS